MREPANDGKEKPCCYCAAGSKPAEVVQHPPSKAQPRVIQWWARQITGWIFVLAGIYFSLAYAFEVI